MMSTPRTFPLLVGVTLAALAAGCGDEPGLDDFLPPVPAPDGTAQAVWAGTITDESELIPGPATSGLPGDLYIRNARARFVIQAPTRVLGVNPYGGNVIDAVPLGPDGADRSGDHLGEVSLMYVAGRTCAHDSIEVLRDGSGGGPAVIRARGRSAVNDFINLRGIAILDLPYDIIPDIEDGVECATTYVLRPDSAALEIAWTLYNGGPADVRGPFAALSDTGGEVASFAPVLGFHRLGFDALGSLGDSVAAPYQVIAGETVSYGILPVHAAPGLTNASYNVVGVSIVLYGAEVLLDILDRGAWYLDLPRKKGVTHRLDLVVGRQPADVEAHHRGLAGEAVATVDGTVTYASGAPGAGAHVGVFTDDGDGALDEDDPVLTYFIADANGAYAGALPPGTYHLRADVEDAARSAASTVTVASTALVVPPIELADPGRFDYTILDQDGQLVPGRLTVVGPHPAPRDPRVQSPFDRRFGIVRTIHAIHGTTMGAAPGDPVDPPLVVPAGGPYRVFVSRGPEWSYDSAPLTVTAGQTGTLTFTLRRVVDTTGYVAAEFHQHAIGSPDSPVPFEDRLRTLVVEGVEFFASTDHDYLADYDPLIDALGVRSLIDGVVGVESTPFAWGHFIAFPLVRDPASPTGGPPDWAQGAQEGFDMLPKELWTALREQGARLVQVNHPRSGSGVDFQHFFDRAALTFDFGARTFGGGVEHEPVPAEWLRHPEDQALFSDEFDSLEVWNGFRQGDTDGDGVRELTGLDLVMRDWMNFLSFGKLVAPVGNSDTHTRELDPAGLPRTMIRVADDSLTQPIEEEIYATLLGEGGAPRDLVVTNGPMIRVSADGGATSAIGRTVAASGGMVTLTIDAQAAEWVDFDTIEVFANATFDAPSGGVTSLPPLVCYTTRDPAGMAETDPCKTAPLAPRPLTVTLGDVAGGKRRQATVTLALAATDVPARAGARGSDAWVVVRARGQRAVFPVLTEGAIAAENLAAIVAASTQAELATAVADRGVPAAAFTAPVLVDFDGGGWLAPFAP